MPANRNPEPTSVYQLHPIGFDQGDCCSPKSRQPNNPVTFRRPGEVNVPGLRARVEEGYMLTCQWVCRDDRITFVLITFCAHQPKISLFCWATLRFWNGYDLRPVVGQLYAPERDNSRNGGVPAPLHAAGLP